MFGLRCMPSAAPSKPTFSNGVAGSLAFAEEFHIRHDRLAGMVRSPMCNVCFIVRNADHQPRCARAPIAGCPHCAGGLVEQILQVRHGYLLRLLPRDRLPLPSVPDCPALSGG